MNGADRENSPDSIRSRTFAHRIRESSLSSCSSDTPDLGSADPRNHVLRCLLGLCFQKQVPLLDLWRELLPHVAKRHHHPAHPLLLRTEGYKFQRIRWEETIEPW